MSLKLHWSDQKPFEIEVKRFYVPFTATSNCPKCGTECEWDNYIGCPGLGTPEPLYFWCECDHEWREYVILNLTAKPTEPPDDC